MLVSDFVHPITGKFMREWYDDAVRIENDREDRRELEKKANALSWKAFLGTQGIDCFHEGVAMTLYRDCKKITVSHMEFSSWGNTNTQRFKYVQRKFEELDG